MAAVFLTTVVVFIAACRSSCPSWWRRLGWRSCTNPDRLADARTAPLLIALEALLAIGYLYAATLSYQAYKRNGHGTDAVLAVGLMLAAFSQVLFAVHPGTYSSLVTAGDILRVAFYATLLATLAVEVRGDIRAACRQRRADPPARSGGGARRQRSVPTSASSTTACRRAVVRAKLKQGRLLALPEIVGTARELAGEVAAAIESALAEARQAILALRPGGREPLPRWCSASWRISPTASDRRRVPLRRGGRPLTPRAQAELLRIVQEALANVRKHADATLVRVEPPRPATAWSCASPTMAAGSRPTRWVAPGMVCRAWNSVPPSSAAA